MTEPAYTTTTPVPCPECGCSNEDCPCSEEINEDEMFNYAVPLGGQAQWDIGY